MPVPTAVPPIASSASAARAAETRRIPWSIWDWYPENSWPKRIGVASIKCVLPDLTIGSNSFAFFARLSSSSRSAGRRLWSTSINAATWMAVGITSFEDWPIFTWSFGWTTPFSPSGWPKISFARFAITSFAFMFVEVPLPVWKMSSGN